MERRLAAILCADVYGYSRLMGQNEEATLRALTSHRKIIDSQIEQHHGRFVNSVGDSVLAEFHSVVEAVNCAVDFQAALKGENGQLPPERRMQFRIGVNLGDVMAEDGQIYGDGVNVAARLESLAEPGGVCISGTVHDQVRDKLPLGYEDLGEQAVKNIARPVHVWRVLLDGAAPRRPTRGVPWKHRRYGALSLTVLALAIAAIVVMQHVSLRQPTAPASIPPYEKPAPRLPSIPSIAVLPFANLSGDLQQEYFSDGITDDLIADLSRVPHLFVIARTSSFIYKGKAEKAQTIGRELGVKYLLEGSTRRAGDQVRINVRLVDAASGDELWSQRYNRQMRDIFKLQDEIVKSLTTTLGLQVSMLEGGIIFPQRTNNLEAYNYFLRGFEELVIATPDAFARARKMFEKAIQLDSGYADAYAWLGFVRINEYSWQLDSDPRALDRTEELARRAVLLDDSNPCGHALLAWVGIMRNRLDEANVEGKRAITLDPNNAVGYIAMAIISDIAGKPEAEITYALKGMRLDPKHPDHYSIYIGRAYNSTGRYREAIDVLRAGLADDPNLHLNLIYAYMELGREQEARAEAAEVIRLSPRFALETVTKMWPGVWDSPGGRHFLDQLRKAGLK